MHAKIQQLQDARKIPDNSTLMIEYRPILFAFNGTNLDIHVTRRHRLNSKTHSPT